jgi:hypothetical protein
VTILFKASDSACGEGAEGECSTVSEGTEGIEGVRDPVCVIQFITHAEGKKWTMHWNEIPKNTLKRGNFSHFYPRQPIIRHLLQGDHALYIRIGLLPFGGKREVKRGSGVAEVDFTPRPVFPLRAEILEEEEA